MTQPTIERVYTAEDVWELAHLPENELKRFELSEGRLIEMPPTGTEHSDVLGDVMFPLRLYLRDHPIGFVTDQSGYILGTTAEGKDVLRASDIGFVLASRFPKGRPKRYVPGPPDFVVEVISPTDKPGEINVKIGEYLDFGVRLIWVCYPEEKRVTVYTPDRAPRVYRMGETLDGGDLLPGFALALSDIFH